MLENNNNETGNVQQGASLTGQVNNQAQRVQAIVGEAVNQPTAGEQERQKQLEELSAMRISARTEVVAETYCLSVDGVGVFAMGDIHGLKGKQKSGKSAVLKVCAAALLSGQQFRVRSELKEPMVLFIDTEQQRADVKLVIDEVKWMTHMEDAYIDSHLFLYALRRRSYDTLLADTRLLIERHQAQVVFIDGLVDYVASFNDEVLSRQLIHDLLMLCEEFGCAIVCVLHENKALDDQNMRGHLGTVLSQKAGSVLQCKKEKSGILNVTCPDARHGQMPQWNIRFDYDGHLVDADEENRWIKEQKEAERKMAKEAKKAQTLQQYLTTVMPFVQRAGGFILRSDLNRQIAEQTGQDRTTVSRHVKALTEAGKLLETVNGMISLAPAATS